MVKRCRVYKMMCYYANVLTHNHAITLADESAPSRFTAVKWYRGAIVMWYRGAMVMRCLGTMVAWHRDVVASNYHGSNVPEYIHARASCKLGELRAGAATKNLT